MNSPVIETVCVTRRLALASLLAAAFAVALAATLSFVLDWSTVADLMLWAAVGGFVLLVLAAFVVAGGSTFDQSEPGGTGTQTVFPATFALAGLLVLVCSFIAGQAVRLLW